MTRPPIEAVLTSVAPRLSGPRLRSDPVYRSRMLESRQKARLQSLIRQAHNLEKSLEQAEGWAFTMGKHAEARRAAHWQAKSAAFFAASRAAFTAKKALEDAIVEAEQQPLRDAIKSGETALAELRGLGF